MTEEEQLIPVAEKWAIPFGAKLDTMNMILKAFFIAGADANFVSQESIEKNTGLGRGTITPNLSFFVYVRALEKNKQDPKLYKLTDMGARYSKAANENNREDMAKEMKNLLDISFKELVNFIGLRKSGGKLDFEAIFNHIKTMARIKDEPNRPRGVNPAYASGISTLIDMLILAGYVEESIRPTEAPTPRKISTQPRPKPSKLGKTSEVTETPSIPAFGVTEGMHLVTWGDSIFMRLKKGDKPTREKIAKIAKQFIDMYAEESEIS